MKTSTPVPTAWLMFLGGMGTGIAGLLLVQTLVPTNALPVSHLQATIYLPLRDNDGRPFADDRWTAAVGLFVARHGGATLGGESEGWWVEDATGQVYREPVRVVVVTLPRDQKSLLDQTLREVGQKLGQKAVYCRLEEVHVRVVPTD